ncbi:MAG: GntR family transcriptional regulator [Rhizobium sp.]|nr:GntR family transcriptional regulator [Rhizobium sp.]
MDHRSYGTKGLHADILNELGRAIVANVHPEGEVLPREVELQEKFGASRQTVREAIRVLTAKGMVYARKRAGTFVTTKANWNFLDPDILAWHEKGTLPSSLLRDIVEMRRLIEPSAAQFAAERGDDQEIARIGAALERMHVNVDQSDHFYEADIEFHMSIFEASGNTLIDRMSTILRPLLEASFRIQSSANEERGLDDGYDVHRAVFEAIEKRDGTEAKRRMELLLDRAVTEVYAKR